MSHSLHHHSLNSISLRVNWEFRLSPGYSHLFLDNNKLSLHTNTQIMMVLGWTGSWPPYNPCVPAITIYAIYKISSPKPRSLLWFIYQITTVILSLLLQLLATILLIVITISLEPSFQIVVWNKITIPPFHLSVGDKSRSLIIRKLPIHDWINFHITTKHEELFLLLKHQ